MLRVIKLILPGSPSYWNQQSTKILSSRTIPFVWSETDHFRGKWSTLRARRLGTAARQYELVLILKRMEKRQKIPINVNIDSSKKPGWNKCSILYGSVNFWALVKLPFLASTNLEMMTTLLAISSHLTSLRILFLCLPVWEVIPLATSYETESLSGNGSIMDLPSLFINSRPVANFCGYLDVFFVCRIQMKGWVLNLSPFETRHNHDSGIGLCLTFCFAYCTVLQNTQERSIEHVIYFWW